MLSIRLQRTGRKGLAHFRLIVQDSHRTPTSGRVVANLGHYNPHTKEHGIDLKLAEKYLSNGAQPSSRVIKLLTDNGLKMPSWVIKPTLKKAAPKKPVEKTKDKADPAVDTKPEPEPEAAVDNETSTEETPKTDKPTAATATKKPVEKTKDKADPAVDTKPEPEPVAEASPKKEVAQEAPKSEQPKPAKPPTKPDKPAS